MQSTLTTHYELHQQQEYLLQEFLKSSLLTKLLTAACKLFRTYERRQTSMEKAIDRVVADPAQSISTESQLKDDQRTVTKSAVPTPVANKQNSGTSEFAHSTEHVFSGTLNNCTINI